MVEDVGAIVVGAGPSGLAVGACLRERRIPFVLLDQAEAVGASWRRHYDRLHLHTVKQLSGLPGMPWPENAPLYPSRAAFVAPSLFQSWNVYTRLVSRVDALPLMISWTTTNPIFTTPNQSSANPRKPPFSTLSSTSRHTRPQRPGSWELEGPNSQLSFLGCGFGHFGTGGLNMGLG